MEMVTSSVILTLATILIVDGIKLFIEVFSKHRKEKTYPKENENVTALVAAWNEEDVIERTIISLLKVFPPENIIIIDDGSTDNTAEIVRKTKPFVRLISIPNGGKVNALHEGLKQVKTPYVLLLDADINLPEDFVIPTKALAEEGATAVSFNVVPILEKNKSFWKKFVISFQVHEYMKSMHIGRRFADISKSVHCISGAAGLFKTSRLRRLAKVHSTVFQGEDLERTLLELTASGKVIFCDSPVYTYVPDSLRVLSKQRINGWWPGLWRNFSLFINLIFKKKIPAILRYELLYEVFALVTNPLRIISFISLIIFKQWLTLGIIFGVYFLLEIISFIRLRQICGKYLKYSAGIITFYNFYSMLQTFLVFSAFFIFLKKKFFSNDWKKVELKKTAQLAASLFFFSVLQAQDTTKTKKDWTTSITYSHISDVGKDRAFNNLELYLGYKNFYAIVNSDPYNTVSAGAYIGSFTVDARYNWKAQAGLARVRYERWLKKNWVPFATVSYGVSPYTADKNSKSFPSIEGGFDKYLKDDRSRIGFSTAKEFGRLHGTTFTAKTKLYKKDLWTGAGASVTSFGKIGGYAEFGYKFIYIQGSYYQDFDFNNFDRSTIGLGFKHSF